MKTVFIIHGTDDSPSSQWFPWLKWELEKRGYQVIVPHFPWIEKESFENWYNTFSPYEHLITSESLFVWHSLGCAFILKLLSKTSFHIKKMILVWVWGEFFSEELNKVQYDTFQKMGFMFPYDWMYHYESFITDLDFEKIQQSAEKRIIINSKNDPFIPLELGENLQKNIDAELILYSHAGHFCKRDGYTEFWDLLDVIEK